MLLTEFRVQCFQAAIDFDSAVSFYGIARIET